MKKSLLVTYVVAALLMIFTRCSEDDVTPNDQVSRAAVSQEEENAMKENDTGRRHTGKYIPKSVTGTIEGVAFTAEYRITEFVHDHNKALYAVGTLSNISGVGLPATVGDLAGKVIKMPVQLPIEEGKATASARITCDILLLTLGPLDLDLLGLQIHLDQVVLEIVAEAGGNNLLGNLLCAVTSLLDGVAAIAAIAELLNNIIDLIGMLP